MAKFDPKKWEVVEEETDDKVFTLRSRDNPDKKQRHAASGGNKEILAAVRAVAEGPPEEVKEKPSKDTFGEGPSIDEVVKEAQNPVEKGMGASTQLQEDIDPSAEMEQAPIAVTPPQQPQVAIPQVNEVVKEQENTTVTTQSKHLDQEFQDSIIQAASGQAKAAAAEAEAVAAQHERLAVDTKATTQAIAKQQQEFEEAQAEREAVAREMHDRLNAMHAEVMGKGMDSNNFFNSGGTGRKLNALVAVALGGLGQAIGGGDTNIALNLIQKAIDRDIEAQKANLVHQREGVAQARGVYKDFLTMTQDQRIAHVASRNAAMDLMKLRAVEIKNSTNSDIVRARADKFIAGIDANVANNIAEINTQVNKVATQRSKNRITQPATTEIIKFSDKEAADLSARKDAIAKLKKVEGILKDPKSRDALMAGPISGRAAQWMIKMGFAPDEETAKLKTSQDLQLALFVKAMSGAQVTDKERQWFEQIMPGIRDQPELAMQKLDVLIGGLEDSYDTTYGTYRANKVQGVDAPQFAPFNAKSSLGFEEQ